jgi:hypothetical protein
VTFGKEMRKCIIMLASLFGVLALASGAAWLSWRAARIRASELLHSYRHADSDAEFTERALAFSWPPHWHFAFVETSMNPFYENGPEKQIDDRGLLCISLSGKWLMAWPQSTNGPDIARLLDEHEECVYQLQRTGWHLSVEPYDKLHAESAPRELTQ